MNRRHTTYIGFGFAAVLGLLAAGERFLQKLAAQSPTNAPRFEVDPMWPKPLPNHWILGNVIGVAVDGDDHIWMSHRPSTVSENERGAALDPPISECCIPAPPVLEFDQAGNLLRHWGGPGPGYEWPTHEHGTSIDYKGNVWLGGGARGDDQVLKFTKDGKFLLQIGHRGKNRGSADTENLGLPAETYVDPSTDELFVADGYGNHRVIVFDATSGAYKRMWGAYGNPPDDTGFPYFGTKGWPIRRDPTDLKPKQFNIAHCVTMSHDGLLYVCDRINDRFQVFRRDGTFVKEVFVLGGTKGWGTVWAVGFSKDPQQRFMYVADGQNQRIHILRRDTLEIIGSFGDGGRTPGRFYGVHSLAVDSKGNIYTGETFEGRRLQRFVYKGGGNIK